MNKTIKTVLCVSGCVFAVGAVCCGIGYALGARPSQIRFANQIGPNGMGFMHGMHWNDFYDDHDYDDLYDHYDTDENYNSGYHSDHLTHHETPESIKSLNIDAACGTISVVEDDVNQIEFLNMNKEDLSISNENGAYTISASELSCSYSNDPRILIKVKEDTILDLLKIQSEAGAVSVKDLDFKEIDIYAQAGAIKLIDVDSEKTTIQSDVGAIYLDGDFRNETVIEGSIGAIDLHLDEHQNTYDYIIQHEMGMVNINGERIRMDDDIMNNNPNAKHHLKVTNETGMINIGFGD